MKYLLTLYPEAWRVRYRAEVEAHLEAEPFRIATALDLIAGAIDARMNPEWIPATTEVAPHPGGQPMSLQTFGALAFSRDDARRSTAWMIGTCLVLTAIGVTLDKTLGDHALIDALLYSSFFIALTVSSRDVALQNCTRTARIATMALVSLGWYAFFLAVIGIGTLI